MSNNSIIRALAVAVSLAVLAVGTVGSGAHAADGDTVDGQFAGAGPIAGGSTYEVAVAGRGGIAHDATAVSLNLTVTQPARHGHATVFPCGADRPLASSINFTTGVTIANALVTDLGSSGRICIYSSASAHVVVDVDGYFVGGGYHGIGPARLLDSRSGHATVDGRSSGTGLQGAGTVYALPVAGRAGLPDDATSVALTLTVADPRDHGHVTVFPCGERRPEASTLNHRAGETVANSFVAEVGDDGRICLYTHAAAHLVVDLTGGLEPSAFRPVGPARLLDSRPGHATVDGRSAAIGRRGPGSVVAVDVTDRGGTSTNAVAVALNVTVDAAGSHGHLTVFPCGSDRPAASTLNYGPGGTIANALLAKVGDGGKVCVFTHAAADLVIDVTGYVPQTGSGYEPIVPVRLADTRRPAPSGPDEQAVEPSLAALNSLRAARGVAPVRLDEGLSAEALGWSVEMSQTGFRHSALGHAENIAWYSASGLSPDDAAGALHDLWVDSPPHLSSMIDPRHTRVGIGLHRSGSGWYGTHLFAP